MINPILTIINPILTPGQPSSTSTIINHCQPLSTKCAISNGFFVPRSSATTPWSAPWALQKAPGRKLRRSLRSWGGANGPRRWCGEKTMENHGNDDFVVIFMVIWWWFKWGYHATWLPSGSRSPKSVLAALFSCRLDTMLRSMTLLTWQPGNLHLPIGSMYAIYGNIYHQYTPFMLALIYQHHGSYGLDNQLSCQITEPSMRA